MDLLTASTVLAAAGDGHDGWWPLWLLVWAAVIATLATLVWRLVRGGRGRGPNGDPFDRARGVLAERFARGEIAADEYRARLAELR